MFGIGGFELFLILLFGFLIFGPDKLPEIAKTIGKAIAKFRNAQEEMKGTLTTQSFVDKDADDPFKNPLTVLENAAGEAQRSAKEAQAKVGAATDAAVDKITEKSESFAERKARYDRERAARKAAEKAEAEAAQKAADAAEREARENPKASVAPKAAADAADGAASDGVPDAAAGDAAARPARSDGAAAEGGDR